MSKDQTQRFKKIKKLSRGWRILLFSSCLVLLLLLPWLTGILSLQAPPDNAVISQLPGELAHLSAGDVYYELSGPVDNPMVVMIHGFSAHAFIWENNYTPLVQQGYCVLRYDLYGRGYSAKPGLANDSQLFRNQLYELLEFLHINKPVNIICASMGALIAADFARHYPAHIAGLVFISPVIGNNQSTANTLMKIPVLGEYLVHSIGTPMLRHTYRQVFVKAGDNKQTLDKFLLPGQFKGYKASLLSSLRHILNSDSGIPYRQLAVQMEFPAILIWGQEDDIVPYAYHRLFLEIFPGMPFYTIQAAGHCSQYEQAEAVNTILLDFLEDT